MNYEASTLKKKILTIKSSPKTPAFNLKIGEVNYGVIKQHNVTQTTTYDTRINLTFNILSTETLISLRTLKDEEITVSWNKYKGRFEVDNPNIILSEKTNSTMFSKLFYLILGIVFLALLICSLLVIL